MDLEWEKIAPEVAIQILGEPSKKDGSYYRWGAKGSLALNLDQGTFFDFENNKGYGLIEFIKERGLNPDDFLKEYKSPVTKSSKSFTDKDMFQLKTEATVYLRYSETFCVMRFPADHFIKQKYAPFTKYQDSWIMKRPDGTLPIYCENKKPEDYVIINEGEKALQGCQSIYDGDVCTWHGGVNNLDKQDWTPLKDRKVIMFPDNDAAGKKCAEELKDKLKDIAAEFIIVKPPREFKEKDDLYDAKVNDFFSSSQQFLDYCLNNQIKKRVSFDLVQVNSIMKNITPPKWVVKDICEEDSVVAIFGQPKSGKSFVTVDLACNIVLGREWHGHDTEQGSVVYLAGEGMRAISRRFLAWQQLNNTRVKDAPLLISTRGARLLDDKDHQLLKDTIDRTQDETGKVRMIVVDTLQRNFGAGNENSTEDMSAFIERIDDLRDTYSTCICIVHHTGHGTSNRARGSSVIQASVDWEYRVARTNLGSDMFVEFSQTLVKDGKPIMPMNFKFVEQTLPFHDMTSGALQLLASDEIPKKTKISEKGQTIVDAIKSAQDKSEEPALVWLGQAEIAKITKLNDSTVKTWLRKLVDQDVLTYEKGKGYQTNEYNTEIF